MAPSSLVAMAQRACTRDMAALQDVGDMSYELAYPILKKIVDPNQLRKIEIASPHIADHDAELWKAFIKRDVPLSDGKIVEPKNPRSWWKVYRKLVREEQEAKEAQEQQLLAALQGFEQQKEANKLNFVNQVLHEPQLTRPKYIDGQLNPRVSQHGDGPNGVVKRPALKNAKTGSDIMYALRKQTVTAAKAKGKTARPLPSVFVRSAKSQITKAPEAMVMNHQKPQFSESALQFANENASRPTRRIFTSRAEPSAVDKAVKDALRAEQAKKEDRLRALTGSKLAAPLSSPPSQPRPTSASTQPSSSRALPTAPPLAVTPAASPARLVLPTSSTKPTTPTLNASSAAKSTLALPTSTAKPLEPACSATPVAAVKAVDEVRSTSSPSPAPPMRRKRPAPSIFMPQKKRKF